MLSNKTLDALGLASLRELADQLRKENMHESADIVLRLAREFSTYKTALESFAQVESDALKGGPMLVFEEYDPIFTQLDRASDLRGIPRVGRPTVSDLMIKLGYKRRLVAIEWVDYIERRADMMYAALGRLAGVWSAMVPPVCQLSSTHPCFGAAWRAYYGIGD